MEEKIFDTLEQAKQYLKEISNGHGKVVGAVTGKTIEQCRCSGKNHPVVYVKDKVNSFDMDKEYLKQKETEGKNRVKVLTPNDELKDIRNGVFLAGPATRGEDAIGWREAFINLFNLWECDCTLLNPEISGYGEFNEERYKKQTDWEITAMHLATRIIFWIPRDEKHRALTTNVEFGEWFSNKATYVGYPIISEHNRYIGTKCEQAGKTPYHNIDQLVGDVINDLNDKPHTYFTSDTHFGSERTFELSKRPFLNTHDMDLKMMSNWNKTVRNCDFVYHLGDFGDWTVFNNLNCAKMVLVEGNYEKKGDMPPADDRIDVRERPMRVKMNDMIYTLVHEPKENYGDDKDAFYLFGHIHQLQYVKRNGLNVGVDCNNYTPVDVSTIGFRTEAIKKHYDENVFCEKVGE